MSKQQQPPPPQQQQQQLDDGVPFELEMSGGAVERRYRNLAGGDTESMPWGTLAADVAGLPDDVVTAARVVWTLAAFREHMAAGAAASTVATLVNARAPLDLMGVATRFALDELVHAELCARIAGELGGGSDLRIPAGPLRRSEPRARSDLAQACVHTVRYFCLGESFSHPLVRETWRAARQPLVKSVVARMMRDDAAHAQFGWLVLDWAMPLVDDGTRALLCDVAAEGVAALWREVRNYDPAERFQTDLAPLFGWLPGPRYEAIARASLVDDVLPGLARHGIVVGGGRLPFDT